MVGPRPISRERTCRDSRCDGPGFTIANGASRNNGWYAGGGFDYMVHKGPLVDVILGLEYQHYDVGSKNAFCVTAALQQH